MELSQAEALEVSDHYPIVFNLSSSTFEPQKSPKLSNANVIYPNNLILLLMMMIILFLN